MQFAEAQDLIQQAVRVVDESLRGALQEVFVDLADAVLHQCIRPLVGALLPAIMDISARATSLRDRPRSRASQELFWV